MQDVLKKLLTNVDNAAVKPTAVILGKEGYQPIPLSIENYKAIPQSPNQTIAFVDSGNAELAKGPNFSLQFIRVAIVSKGRKTMLQEAYCLVQAVQENGKLVYKTTVTGLEGIRLPVIDLYEPSLAEGTHRVAPGKVAELARVLAEHLLASWAIPELPKGSILVRDGDLEAHTLYEQTALREIYERARINGITIAGLSKTSSLLTDTGHPAVPVIARDAPRGTWYYHPIAISSKLDHQASVAIAKLHPLAERAFRIDIFDQQESFLPEVVSALAENSADAAMLGYPYGLIEADRYARVREEEKAYLRTQAEVLNGGMLKSNESALDAHDVLNRVV